jgi:lipopolysaccharide export LptBFGC system permease protein LptF
MGEWDMFTTKLNLVAPFALAVLGVIIALIEPALAQVPTPAPLIGAGLPAVAVLGGGYWLIRKLRGRH